MTDETDDRKVTGRPDVTAEPPSDRPAGETSPAQAAHGAVRFSRRWFLIGFGGLVAGLAGLFGLLRGPGGSQRRSTLSGQPGSVAASFPVIAVDRVPNMPLEEWVIEVDGLVKHPLRIDHAAWVALPRTNETVDFNCVEGWGVDDVLWSGVRPSEILKLAEPLPEATYVNFESYDGTYADSLSMDQVSDRYTLLADRLGGSPLSADHGGPVRLVVPTQLAYKSVKFVKRIELIKKQRPGFWESRGYPIDAPVEPRAT